ncbi:hypothetical protein [Gordonia sp. KTR9]|uniref:hypothetical protein n=1 Tax=Gordonia sp. KTR9 TaxID=337191 RepID=UPI0005CB1C8B|nr:hypothetical protein [Gordonia sp. KTR9]
MSPGYTVEEIAGFVREYLALPHGQKKVWLRSKPFSRDQMVRWRRKYLAGDLERGLLPRNEVTRADAIRRVMAAEEKLAAAPRSHAEELAALRTQIATLESGNAALGRAIGLLRTLESPGPGDAQNDPTSAT